MEKIARGGNREANIAHAKINWFIVLPCLFEQIAKVFLGAIEQQ